MKKKIIIAIIAVAVVGSIGVSIAKKKEDSKYTQVKTGAVEKGELKAYLSTTGVVKSKNSKDYFGPQGKVKKVNVKAGDKVTKGQVLATFDVQDATSGVKQAELQYDNAVLSKQVLLNNGADIEDKIADLNSKIAKIDKSINALDGSKKLDDVANVKSLESEKAQLEQAKDSLKPVSSQQVKQANNAIEAAQIALDSAKQNASKNIDAIYADFDGVITSVNISEGAMCTGAQPSITEQVLDDLKLVVSVGKFDANKVSLGQEAIIKDGDKILKGKVSYVSPTAVKVASASGVDTSLQVDVDVLEKADDLKIEFEEDVDILLADVNDVLRVPAESVKTDKNGVSYVYVVEGNKAVEKKVELGVQSDVEVEVKGGIKQGDKVILNPSANITSGVLVKEGVK